MLDLEELSKLRFGMSEVPEVGGQPGTYEENGPSGSSNDRFSETSFTEIRKRKRDKSLPMRSCSSTTSF
jgi:hypothetical protein